MIGLPELAAHDLRRTYAQLGFDAGVPTTQMSKPLGHSSVETTQRYLNLDLDLEVTASDFVPPCSGARLGRRPLPIDAVLHLLPE
jgi:site-specific recombinase XerC